MPARLTQVKAAFLCRSVQGDKLLPTPQPRSIDSDIWSIKAPCGEATPELSACQSMLRSLVSMEHAFGGVMPFVQARGTVIQPRLDVRSSEKSMLACPAGQPGPLAGLSQTWGA
jgi:hypothetical protein